MNSNSSSNNSNQNAEAPKGAFVALAPIVKRHVFQSNKWKCLPFSGEASAWLSSLTEIYLGDNYQKVSPVVISSTTGQPYFLITFEDNFPVQEGQVLYLPRTAFPALEDGAVYLCDLMSEIIYSPDLKRRFQLKEFLENGTPRVSSLILILEEIFEKAPSTSRRLEIPFHSLKKIDAHWILSDLEIWENDSGEYSERDE